MIERNLQKEKRIYIKMNGFSLIEILVTASLISISLIAILGSFAQLVKADAMADNKAIALYLSQEGIEAVRNIRDSNWLDENLDWNEGISNGNFILLLNLTTGEWTLEEVGLGNRWKTQVYYDPDDNLFLQSKYKNPPQLPATWRKTNFFREIIIEKYDPEGLNIESFIVQSKVWFGDNEGNAVIAEEYFCNWQ